MKYLPFSLAWAETDHTFQGQSAGHDCLVPCTIVQPGSKAWMDYAQDYFICFCHEQLILELKMIERNQHFFTSDLNKERVTNLTKNAIGALYKWKSLKKHQHGEIQMQFII